MSELRSKPTLRTRAWELALTGLVLVILSYTWMFSAISVPNERSRVYLAVAMVDEGTVEVDTSVKRFGRIYDLARFEGHYYSDKAPGSSILAAAVYGGVRLFSEPEDWKISELINLMRTWLMIPFGVIGFLFSRRLLRRFGLDPPLIDIVSLTWILGSAAFHYSTAFFGHQIVAVALLGAYWLVKESEFRLQRMGKGATGIGWRLAAAGGLCGLAGLTEYQAGIPCVLLALYLLASPLRSRWKALLAFGAAAVPFVVVLLAYNHAAFGGPFELSYHHLANKHLQEVHGQGIAGVTIPTWEYFKGSMFSFHRGLFTTSPFFLLVPVGIVVLFMRRQWRDVLLLGLIFVYFVAFISSSNMWYAGWGFGPRLLVPAMGYFAILAGVGADALFRHMPAQIPIRAAAICGIAYHQTVHAFFPEAPDSSKNPIVDYVFRMWEADIVSPNLVEKFTDIRGVESLYPLAILVAIVIGIVLVRGLLDLRGWKRPVVALATLVLVAAYGVWITGQNPSKKWDEAGQKKWMRTLDRWEKRETSFEKKVRKKYRKVREM